MLAKGIETVVVERADNLIVPFKPEPEDHSFELDFERTEYQGNGDLRPNWQEMKKAVSPDNAEGGGNGSERRPNQPGKGSVRKR